MNWRTEDLTGVPATSALGMARASLWWHVKDVLRESVSARWSGMPVVPFFLNAALVSSFPITLPLIAWIRRNEQRHQCDQWEKEKTQWKQ